MPRTKKTYMARGTKVATEHAPKLRKEIVAMSDSEKKKKRRRTLVKKVATGLTKAITEPRKARPPKASRQQRIQNQLDKELATLKNIRSNPRIPKSVKADLAAKTKKRIDIFRKGLAGLKILKKGK